MANHDLPEATSSVADSLVFVVASALAGVVLAFPAAWIWATLADPPSAPLTRQGVSFGEVQLNQLSEVTLWFLSVGFAMGLLAGVAVGWLGRRRGVASVAAVVALCAVGAALSGYLGIALFGPDEKSQAAAAAVGDQITSDLSVGSVLAYLGWPIGGLLGACLAIFRWPVPENDTSTAPHASSVVAQSSSTGGP